MVSIVLPSQMRAKRSLAPVFCLTLNHSSVVFELLFYCTCIKDSLLSKLLEDRIG